LLFDSNLVLDWICGFANAQGGKIYIGKDANGAVVNVRTLKNRKSIVEPQPKTNRQTTNI
jgi:ATP-dependent DNA helicase RecG